MRLSTCARAWMAEGAAFAAIATPAAAITNGEVDTTNKYSNVGAIVVIHHPTRPVPYVLGSGSLVHPRVFLTAGHVTYAINNAIAAGRITVDDVRISFGRNALDPSTWLPADAFITHPQFRLTDGNSGPDLHDVGVAVLHDPITTIRSVTLAAPGFLDQLWASGALRDGADAAPFLAVGYGSTLDWPPPEEIPPDGLRRSVNSGFMALRDSWLFMNQSIALGYGGTAHGDSGGPRFWTQPDGSLLQVAITSKGPSTDISLDDAYRVDTTEVQDFLSTVIATVE
jgi:hypothetical protein